ncbi:MAG TPA: twin-arginine translocation signal domain-containing protein [Rhodanobacteraceae bacterium]|nr:twin-arginine translocation signal domain-containing protein [Rhodanobacteraceae bacterium]
MARIAYQIGRALRGDDMPDLDRRKFLKLAASLGAALAVGCSPIRESSSGWRERRDL